MTQLREIYRCEVCGNVVEIVNEGQPALVCCNQPMTKLEAKTSDEGQEKHVPVIEGEDGNLVVKVGSIEHPMEEKHYIKFIEVITKSSVTRIELKPGEKPEAKLYSGLKKENIIAVREFCTVHMLWKA